MKRKTANHNKKETDMTNDKKEQVRVVFVEEHDASKLYDWEKQKLQNGEWLPINGELPTADQLFDAIPQGTKALHIRMREGERTGYVHICISTGKPVDRRHEDYNGWMYPDDNMPEKGHETLHDKFSSWIYHFKAPKAITRHWCKNIASYIRWMKGIAAGCGDQAWEIERRYYWPLCMKGGRDW